MSDNPFYFKQFKVFHNNSAMKVGTDAVLLGAWTDASEADTILEIGTGCGVIALMLAQKSFALIDAVEIDEQSYYQAIQNFEMSPWKDRLNVINIDFKDFILQHKTKYSLIVSNPPYYNKSLKSGDFRKNIAKHNDFLSFEVLAFGISKLMHDNGKASIIMPIKEFEIFSQFAVINNLYCNKKTFVLPQINRTPNRVLSLWSKSKSITEESYICLKDKESNISDEYKELTKDYYL